MQQPARCPRATLASVVLCAQLLNFLIPAASLAQGGNTSNVQRGQEYYEQSRLWSNPIRFAVWIARRSHGLHARPRVEELQHTTQRPLRAAGARIHIVHAGPCTVRMRVRCVVGPGAAEGSPRGNR